MMKVFWRKRRFLSFVCVLLIYDFLILHESFLCALFLYVFLTHTQFLFQKDMNRSIMAVVDALYFCVFLSHSLIWFRKNIGHSG